MVFLTNIVESRRTAKQKPPTREDTYGEVEREELLEAGFLQTATLFTDGRRYFYELG